MFAVLPIPRGNAADAQSDTPHVLVYLLAAWLARRRSSAGACCDWPAPAWPAAWPIGSGPRDSKFSRRAGLPGVAGLRGHWTWRRMGLAAATLAGTALVSRRALSDSGRQDHQQTTSVRQGRPGSDVHRHNWPRHAGAGPKDRGVGRRKPRQTLVNLSSPEPHRASRRPQKRYTATLVLKLIGNALQAFINSICQGFKFVFIPLYLIGHVELIRRKPDWLQIAMIALLAATHVVILLAVYTLSGYIAHRHVLPLVALAMPFTALGVIVVGDLRRPSAQDATRLSSCWPLGPVVRRRVAVHLAVGQSRIRAGDRSHALGASRAPNPERASCATRPTCNSMARCRLPTWVPGP